MECAELWEFDLPVGDNSVTAGNPKYVAVFVGARLPLVMRPKSAALLLGYFGMERLPIGDHFFDAGRNAVEPLWTRRAFPSRVRGIAGRSSFAAIFLFIYRLRL